MTPLAAFPDVEAATAVLLRTLGNADTFLPADLKSRMPFHRPYRFTGGNDRISDHPVLGVDTFAATYAAGKAAAEAARQLLLAAPHEVVVDGVTVVLDDVRCPEGPHEVPWGDSAVRRWVATYTVTLRRPALQA